MNDIKITYTVYSKYPNPDDMIAELEARLARLEEAGNELEFASRGYVNSKLCTAW